MNVEGTRRGQRMLKPARSSGRRRIGSRLAAPLFHKLLDRVDAGMDFGTFEGVLPDGTTRIIGGRSDGPLVRIVLHRWRSLLRLMLGGSVGWYRAWDRGEWDSDDLTGVFDLFSRNRGGLKDTGRASGPAKWLNRLAHARRKNDRQGALDNIAFHYDLGNDFYACWLDPTMSYSCARFADEAMPLEAAQRDKVDAMIARLGLSPGQSCLEIGCGWGFLSGQLARDHDVKALGISLSHAQTDWARAQHPQAEFRLQDYRDVGEAEHAGPFDAIVSVEMVEAVGQSYWPDFLDCVARNLKPGGRAAIQYIAIDDDIFERYAANVDFIQTYIFPGGMLLSQSRFRALAEAKGLVWTDQQNFGVDYARTLRLWRERFDAAIESGQLPSGFDVRFVRLWRYYLHYCEGGFRGGGIDVAQVTLIKPKT
jgi:cyclopropane-fatty-acyl-phospholipid synthase